MADLTSALERFATHLTVAIAAATLRALAPPPRQRARRRARPAVRPPPQGVESGRGSGHEDELGPPVDELFRSWGIG